MERPDPERFSHVLSATVSQATLTDKTLSFWKGLIFRFLTLGIYSLWEFYWMVKRRDMHLRRFYGLAQAFLSWVEAEAGRKRLDVRYELHALRNAMGRPPVERGAAAWLVVWMFAGPVALYAYHFLWRDFSEHERQELAFYQAAQEALYRLRATYSPAPLWEPTIRRISFWRYLLLSVLTLGLFATYWHYRLIQDPNSHFQRNARAEEWLLQGVRQGAF